ncbi:MAG: DUF1080 domain-containing protein, partial [Verrucomicrobiota bacterium]
MPRPALLLLLGFVATAGPAADLFNGRDLAGWTRRGGEAENRVENGEIVGQARPGTPNAFLCTTRSFTNFILELEFKPMTGLNSGIQIRSEVRSSPTNFVWKDRKVSIAAGRVHGYQVEIDTDPTNQGNRQWTAGLYDEGRRLWLFPGSLGGDKATFSEQGRRLTKVGGWNHVRIEAVGPRIRTWLNGELRADVLDGVTRSGFI